MYVIIHSSLSIYIYIERERDICIHIYIYICVYVERERYRERESVNYWLRRVAMPCYFVSGRAVRHGDPLRVGLVSVAAEPGAIIYVFVVSPNETRLQPCQGTGSVFSVGQSPPWLVLVRVHLYWCVCCITYI